VFAGDRYLGLAGPGPAELSGASGEQSPRIGVDEELGHCRSRQPAAVASDDVVDVGRGSVDGDLPWPHERRQPVLSGRAERPPVLVHLVVGEGALDSARQERVDEEVVLEDHLLAGS
jgi:hypothetical protein